VLAYNYGLDRQAGRIFEAGGIGGLISAGVFSSLLLPIATKDHYDGASLQQYERGSTINGLAIYHRRPPLIH
jgi:hypothetical protein